MTAMNLTKNKKFQIAVLVTLTAGVIIFSLLTDFPKNEGQGALRNKRFGPAMQVPQTQSIQPGQLIQPQNLNTPIQGYDMPANGGLVPAPTVNGYDMPANGG